MASKIVASVLFDDQTGIWKDALNDYAYGVISERLGKVQEAVVLYIENRNCLDKIIYFAQDTRNQLIKIGVTTNLSNLDLIIPKNMSIEILFFAPGNTVIENEILDKFSHLRVHGDWFAGEEELLDFIERLAKEEIESFNTESN